MIDWNILVSQIATVAFDIVYFGAIISTIVVIILDNRNPVKTMAWILILLFLPIVGQFLTVNSINIFFTGFQLFLL